MKSIVTGWSKTLVKEVLAFSGILIVFYISVFINLLYDFSTVEAAQQFCRLLLKSLGIPSGLIYSIPFFLVYSFRFFSGNSDRQGRTRLSSRPAFLTIFPGLIIWSVTQMFFLVNSKGLDDFTESIISRSSARTTGDLLNVESKLKGVYYFGRFRADDVDFQNIIGNNIEHLVLVPYGHMESFDKPVLSFTGRGRRTSIDRDSMF